MIQLKDVQTSKKREEKNDAKASLKKTMAEKF